MDRITVNTQLIVHNISTVIRGNEGRFIPKGKNWLDLIHFLMSVFGSSATGFFSWLD
jgi:hypothetical protein